MVEGFSISEAMAAPVRVIRRHPVSVFVWGFVIMAFTLVMMSLVFGAMADIPLSADAEPSPELMGRIIAMQGVSMMLNIGQLALTVMVWAATMRATLRIGRPDRYFFLRAGMDELRLAVVGLALFVGAYIAVIVAVLAGTLISALIWQISQAAAVVAGLVLLLLLIAAVAVAMARLSMIAPATIILKRFAFIEGWTLGKGRTLPLVGLLVCTWLAYMLIYFVLAFAVIVVLFASGAIAYLQTVQEPATLGELFPSPPVMWGVAAGALLPGAFLYGSVITLLSAPFAAVCRALLDGASPRDAAATMG